MTDLAIHDGLDAHRDPTVEALLDAHDLLPADLEAVTLDRIDWDTTRATQVRGDGIEPDVVDRYAAALDRGEPLPAGIGIDGPGGVRLIGGIHRAEAARAADQDATPLYVLPADANPTAVLLISIEHNARHGVPLTNTDRARHALALIDDHGLTQAEAAAIVGLSGPKVSQAATARDGDRRARRTGHAVLWGSFSWSVRYKLAAAAKGHTDAVFAEMVDTAAQADVDTAKAAEISAGLVAADTEAEALDFLADYEVGHYPGATQRSSQSAKLRSAAMTVCDIDPARFAASVTPSFVDPTISLLERTARRLAECAVELNRRKAAE